MLESFFQDKLLEAGCDEVGRGCLAGPVVAAAVILPMNYGNVLLDDSKKLSENVRLKLELDIKEKALCWAIGEVSHEEVDKINVLNASFLAMHRALDKLKVVPEFLLIDGNRFNKYREVPHQCIVKGDGKYFSIAAASILAKNYRDKLMADLSKTYPHYGWDTNVGYPTNKHREGIRLHGITKYHRRSFQLLPRQLDLFKQQNDVKKDTTPR